MRKIAIIILSITFLIACEEEKPKAVVQEQPPVEVKPQSIKLPAEKLDSGAKVVYLTFDDGPLPGSEAINRLVNEQKFKASVFIVGKHSQNNRNSMRIIDNFKKNPYIDVCNHSYTHANNDYDKFYKKPDMAYADIVKNQNDMALDLKIVRLPGRQLWLLPMRDLNMRVSSAGPTAALLGKDSFKIMGWDIEWNNKGNKPKETPAEMLEKIEKLFKDDMTFTRNHLVILSHDVMFSKPEGEADLIKLVELLRNKGYVLENIRHYPDNDVF